MKKLLCLLLALLLLNLCLVSCKDDETPAETTEPARQAPALADIDMTELDSLDGVSESDTETDYVLITVKKYGQILIRLYPEVAPDSVANFKKLVSEEFYDDLIFHRVIKNFMIQGGDPLGTGSGGSGETVKGEFASNGFENNLAHVRGVVSMARSSLPNSASSQFFIVHKTSAHLDGEYAAFGYVVYGMDVVDKIASVRTNSSDKPLTDVVMESVRFATVSE